MLLKYMSIHPAYFVAQSNILIRSKINKAQSYWQNRLRRRALLYEQLCRSRRNDIDLWLTLAVINRKWGFQADTACRQAMSLQKNHALAHHIADR
jgi:hypothetical protein